MILYRVNGAFPYVVGTQAEAKRAAKDCNCDWEQVNVPTDKEGLIAYLNTHDGPADSVVHLEHNPGEVEKVVERYVSATPVSIDTQTDVEDYILNRASVAQVSNIFACLGTRFKELANK